MLERRRRGRPPLWARHWSPEPTLDVEDVDEDEDEDYLADEDDDEPARGSVQELIAVVEGFEARHPRGSSF